MSVFRCGNTICIVAKNEAENMDIYLDRGNFIVSQKPKNDSEYNKILLYSNIYINCKYLGCSYNKNIMDEMYNMREKCKVE